MTHRMEILRRERELTAELFNGSVSDEEKRQLARRLSTPDRRIEEALPDPQLDLPLAVA